LNSSIFKYDISKTPTNNRFLIGFVVNRLILSLKNKRINVNSFDGKRIYKNKNLIKKLSKSCKDTQENIHNIVKKYIGDFEGYEFKIL
jgi:hypothetical protein